jgi:S1-C subfamily serine protease
MDMKITPPHLPPQTCDVRWYRRMQSLPGLLAVIALAVFAGASTALIVSGWMISSFIPSQVPHYFDASNLADGAVDSATVKYVEERKILIYDKRAKIDSKFYPSGDIFLQAALLSSDGWAVTMYEKYRQNAEFAWESFDEYGKQYEIEKTFFDSKTGLLYLKFRGTGFRIFSFSDWDNLYEGSKVYALNEDKNFQTWLNSNEQTIAEKSYPIWKQHKIYSLKTAATENSFILDSAGGLAGFINSKGNLVPSYLIEYSFSSILNQNRLAMKTLDISGMYVDVLATQETEKPAAYVRGFFVSSARLPLKRGDVIISVDNRPVDFLRTPYYIFKSSNNVPLQIYRNGERLDLEVEKTNIK